MFQARFIYSFFLVLFVSIGNSYAETIPATYGYLTTSPSMMYRAAGATGSSPDEVCPLTGNPYWIPGNNPNCGPDNQGTCGNTPTNARICMAIDYTCPEGYSLSSTICQKPGYVCPSTGGWSLSGTSCTRPDPVNCTPMAGKISSDTFKDTGATKVGDYIMVDGCRAKVKFRDSYTSCAFGESGFGACTQQVDIEYQYDGTNEQDQNNPEKSPKPTDADSCRAAGKNVVTSASGTSCFDPSPDKPTTTEGATKKETVNPDGSKTTVEKTVIENCTGAGSCTTTTTTTVGGKNADGTDKPPQTTTTTAPSAGTGTGQGKGSDTGSFCSENPDNVLCRRGDVKKKSKFEKRDDEIEEAKTALLQEFNNIKSGLSQKFGSFSGGGGSLPCPDSVTILGKSVSFGCASGYEAELSKIGAALVFMAAIASAFIVLRR